MKCRKSLETPDNIFQIIILQIPQIQRVPNALAALGRNLNLARPGLFLNSAHLLVFMDYLAVMPLILYFGVLNPFQGVGG